MILKDLNLLVKELRDSKSPGQAISSVTECIAELFQEFEKWFQHHIVLIWLLKTTGDGEKENALKFLYEDIIHDLQYPNWAQKIVNWV